uniref:aromatic ring-hydroxylating oxygenase subunit alpha n=1 Tax=Zoogloea sp. TaxID=49181 RepID=UPI0035B121D7
MTSQATSKGHTLADLVQHDRVHTSLYTDPAIFEDEMDKVFANTWVWVAHASEIPEAGSYKTGYIGRQPVVTVRDRKQQVHVLLNRCRHRAATVCEGHKGKTNSFVCPYHGWSYSLDGALRGVPSPESYGDLLDKADYPLVKLRVEEYAGM